MATQSTTARTTRTIRRRKKKAGRTTTAAKAKAVATKAKAVVARAKPDANGDDRPRYRVKRDGVDSCVVLVKAADAKSTDKSFSQARAELFEVLRAIQAKAKNPDLVESVRLAILECHALRKSDVKKARLH